MINNLLIWLFGHNWSKYSTGLLTDTRSEEDQQQDYAHEERVFPQSADPFGNPRIIQSPFPYQNQNSTSECVPHGVGLGLAIERKNDTGVYAQLSPTFIYRLRSNYPGPGSVPSEIFNLYKKYGSPLYASLPTPLNEVTANAAILTTQMYTEAEIFKGKEYYMVKQNPNNIATLANIAAQNHGVPITIFGTYEEWAQSTPQIYNPNLTISQAEVAHEVCVLPNSGFLNGNRRFVVIQDSAWFGGYQLRSLSEDFITARVTSAGYWDTVDVLGSGIYPKYTFTKTLRYGATGDEVKMLQQLLIAAGCLPADCATGLFGGRTLAGVRAFQNKYASEILIPIGLNAPTNTWGSACIAKANGLCGS